MTKIEAEPISFELTEYENRPIISPTSKDPSVQKPFSYENLAFSNEPTKISIPENGTIITTKLQKSDDPIKAVDKENHNGDDDDNDNDRSGFERLPGDGNKIGLFILKMRQYLVGIMETDSKIPGLILKISCLIGFIIFFGFAVSVIYGTPPFPIRGNVFYGNQGFAFFFLVVFAIFVFSWEKFLRGFIERSIKNLSSRKCDNRLWNASFGLLRKYSWIGHILVFSAVALYIGLTIHHARNLISLIGIIVLILLGTLGSKYPHRIRWHTVFYSFIIQFILAVFVIRVQAGYEFFDFLGKLVTSFIDNAAAGAIFVFGKSYEDHFYVFKITSIIIFLGSIINVLYYLGIMQYVIGKIAWLMQKCLDTTAAESMNAAANIFVGMTEAPLMIRPLVPTMTTSELHAVMVGGFATMAGSVLATFIYFGVPANHLIAASVMAAPGALGFAKLLLPETHKSKTSWDTVKNVPLPDQHNVIDALMNGAGNTLKICGYLIANLIAFISLLKFLDVTISWLFALVHHPEVNFQFLLGLIFYPFALITGIPIKDCLLASKLIGIKVSLNEFIAYEELGKIRNLRDALIKNGTFPLYLNGTLKLPKDTQMLWDSSSVIILTYALCGFANFGSMGISLAALGVFAPERKRTLTKIALRALIGGNMVSLMTASISGLLYDARETSINSNLTLI